MDITDLVASTKTGTISVDGLTASFEFDQNALTPATESALGEAPDGQKGKVLAEIVSSLVVSWDITKQGEPYPPTLENCMHLPFSFIIAVFEAITESLSAEASEEGKV